MEFWEEMVIEEECLISELKGGCVWVKYFEHKRLQNYTKVAKSQYEVEVKSMIDLMQVKKDILYYVHDVRPVKGMGSGLSDCHMYCVL